MDLAPADSSALTIAVIGGGVMGGTLFRALLAVDDPPVAHAVVAETRAARRAELLAEVAPLVAGRDVRATADAIEAVRGAEVVVLAVKPQDARATLLALAGELGPQTVLLSICAGLSTATLAGWLPAGVRVVRAMPNTPARIGEGATAVCAGAAASPADLDLVVRLLGRSGVVVPVAEDKMGAVTGVSGSGPAFVLLAMEAMIDAGVELGLTRAVAHDLAVQTFRGTAGLALEPGSHPTLLREAVTSPGGTTAAGLAALEKHGVRAGIAAAVRATSARNAELGA